MTEKILTFASLQYILHNGTAVLRRLASRKMTINKYDMRKLTLAAALLAAVALQAQETKADKPTPWFSNIKLSGYSIVEYQYSAQKGSKSNTFDLRLARVSLDGRLKGDFYWKAQMQINGNTSTKGSSPRLVDLFAEWQKYTFFRVKAGQFKLPFTFENPMHPIDQGFMGYSQNISSLSGFSDRSGGHSSNGRDIGVQVQGDFLKTSGGRDLLHYQAGVFNGQGINTKDVDQRKTVAGGLWVMPVEGLRIGVFGLEGSYARKYTFTDDEGAKRTVTKSLPQHRYALSAEYKTKSDWTLRSEYIHSTGEGFKTSDNEKNADLTLNGYGSKADGLYALAIAPVVKQKAHVKARYNMYRRDGEWGSAKTMYEIGADYNFTKNVGISAEYAFVNDRTLASHNYSMADVQMYFRF